jgi:hypothetical protein
MKTSIHLLFLSSFFSSTHLTQAVDSKIPIIQAIEQKDYPALQRFIEKAEFSPLDKRFIIDFASKKAEQNSSASILSSDTKKSLFATLCVAFVAISCFALEKPVKLLEAGVRLSPSAHAPHALLAASSLGAGIFCGYECEFGFYNDRPRYIRDYVVEKLQKGAAPHISTTVYINNMPIIVSAS